MSHLAGWALCLVASVLGPGQGVHVDHVVHTGHFERNDSGLEGKESYLAITDRKGFDRIFGVAYTMGKAPRIVPANALDQRLVLAVIKRGGDVWQYQVQDVTRDGDTLSVRYRATSRSGEGARFRSPLVLSVPRGPYRKVVFVENGKEVGKAAIEPAKTP